MFNSMMESIWKSRDNELPRNNYRFKEEDIEPHDIPVTLGDISNLSEFFDAWINEVRHIIIEENMDPLNISKSVHQEINGLITTATLDINGISVHNLSKLTRQTAFKADYIERVMTITIPISFIDVKVFTDYKLNAGSVVISEGRIMGRVGDLSLYITFAINFIHKHLAFIDFGVPKSEQISISFQGDGLSKYLLNILTPIMITIFKNLLIGIMVPHVSKAIEKQFGIVNDIIAEVRRVILNEHQEEAEASAASATSLENSTESN